MLQARQDWWTDTALYAYKFVIPSVKSSDTYQMQTSCTEYSGTAHDDVILDVRSGQS